MPDKRFAPRAQLRYLKDGYVRCKRRKVEGIEMALNLASVGKNTSEFVHEYTFRDTVLYALGCGAKEDELPFLFEKHGPLVLPTYAVVPAYEALDELFAMVDGDLLGVVHGAQSITLHRPFKPTDRLTTVGTVKGLYDLKRMATGVFTTKTHNAEGELVAETEWDIVYRFDGGFGGERPPKAPRYTAPDREPDFVIEDTSTREQALLYRLMGDHNPLHADPEVGEKAGFGRPILHGLATYGYVGRAIVKACCDGKPERLKQLSGRFTKPVWPGDTIITEGFVEDGRVLIRARTKERPEEIVFGGGVAIID